MKTTLLCAAIAGALLGAHPAWLHAAETTLTVGVDQPGAKISPTLYGIFFEDINLGADGGLYAELVKNRSFEFPEPLMGWKTTSSDPHAQGQLEIGTNQPLHADNPHFLRLTLGEAPVGFGVINEGFRGMGVKEGATYDFSVYARSTGSKPRQLVIMLAAPDGKTLAETRLENFSSKWQRRTAALRASATEPKAKLLVLMLGPGTLDLDMVSLFPHDTWKNRPNGLRSDLVQWLKDLHPGFMRFPGGCIVEGRDLATRYQWKTTIGDVAQRRLIINRWNTEFKHRPTPDYFQSFGLGFYEYFQLCEDIGAAPLPILNCGMACQFNTGQLVPLDQLDPYVQDALDLIEFANGSSLSKWGSKRAAMGHPAPFKMKLLGVGNEQWGPEYISRYEQFAKVLKAKHPEIRLISSAGPSPADDRFNFAWGKLRALKADIVDEHCYDKPEWFFKNASRFDKYDRTGPKVFMGEYAAQSVATCSPENRNNWACALAEAAFMTGLERNADVVQLSSYAPLFGHEEGWQWRPNLIWFDNLRSYGTPNYYVQQLFGANRGDVVLPVLARPQSTNQQTLFVSASRLTRAGTVIVKVVNGSKQPVVSEVKLTGLQRIDPNVSVTSLAASDLDTINTLDEPKRVAPVTDTIQAASPTIACTFKPQSLTVLRITPGK